MPDSTFQTWFITGASSGFGEALATHILEKGGCVAATFRKPEQADAFTAQQPGRTFGVVCDVTNEPQVKTAVAAAIAHFGHLDVVVNNAGYGSMGSIEEVPAEEVQRQFDVNVFGALHVLRAVLPHLRERRAGHILNITSIGGLRAFPGVGIYNASKFALEGIGESLALQLAPLGIHVTNVEPSGFRTKWAGESATIANTKIDDYQSTVGENIRAIQGYSGRQPGDPVRAAHAMYEVVQLAKPPLHLPLGKAAVKGAREKFAALSKELEQYAEMGEAADFPAGE
ncbi:SDR family NAD(P)-dependent oxidoreductase [Hymenobacter sp. BT664]|uniref:SDR family NAD(P)-dependent oxidoreductase n=1 Tax=Hymenobacter montanus TaxID=2771359 RepID=A0A927BBE4_9BACT|nr:oxidoreductase [Hymenobacter montanus]MBD2767074.1 SDR family NAD(P)-dependent oxidoreductase [Hymenobacter montanus]